MINAAVVSYTTRGLAHKCYGHSSSLSVVINVLIKSRKIFKTKILKNITLKHKRKHSLIKLDRKLKLKPNRLELEEKLKHKRNKKKSK